VPGGPSRHRQSHPLVGRDLVRVPVCVLGAAFKPGSDNVRGSVALDVAPILHGMAARVTVYHPAGQDSARRASPKLGHAVTVVKPPQDAQVVPLLTEWPEVAGLNPGSLSSAVARRNVVDARNVLDRDVWRDAGGINRALVATRDTSDPGASHHGTRGMDRMVVTGNPRRTAAREVQGPGISAP
jgi:UDP-glucose/GDP-mannose dehydrogenase family protein